MGRNLNSPALNNDCSRLLAWDETTGDEVYREVSSIKTSELENDGDGTSPYATLMNLEPHTIRRVMVQEHSTDNKRNDQASMIRLNDGRLMVAYSHFGPGSEDLDESSVHYQFSEDNGITWSESQELVAPIALGSYIPSLYKKANGNILLVFFVREQATPVFLSSLRSIEYTPDMSSIVTPMETILSASGYSPVGSDRLFYDENTDRLLMPYPVLMSGLGSSTNSVYQTRFLISDDEGDTWADSGLTFDGFLNLDGFGGAMEPGFFVNKDKITIYSRNVVGNINACDLTWTGAAYTKGTEYKLKIGAMNAQSSIKYVPLLRAWIASYTRLYDTPTSTRNQIDVSISRDATNWQKIFTVDDILQEGGYMVNEPNILIDDKIYITYSIDKTNGTYDLKLLTIPLESLVGIDNKALNTYTANPTILEANEIADSRFLLTDVFDASVFNHRVRSFIDIKDDVESASPSSRSLPSFIAGQYITNTATTVKNLDLGVISAFAPQQIIDKVRVKSVLAKIYASSFSGNSLKNNAVIDTYAVINAEEILPSGVTTGTITDKYFIRQLGANDKSYFNGSIGIGTSTPTEKLDVVGNAKISGSIVANNFNSVEIKSDFQTNTFVGDNSGLNNTYLSSTQGAQNTFFGAESGRNNTTGYANSFSGYGSAYINTTGSGKTAFGYQSAFLGNTNNYGCYFGTDAGFFDGGDYNSFWGHHSGKGSGSVIRITGIENMFFGRETATLSTTGSYNSFFGNRAGFNHTTGSHNTVLGYLAGFGLTTGSMNTISGREAGQALTTQNNNVFTGYRAGYNAASAGNTGIGFSTLFNMTSGAGNTALGSGAGDDIQTGSNNTFIGLNSGNNALQLTSANFSTAIGYNSYTTKSNQMVLGHSGINETLVRGTTLVNTETDDGTGSKLQVNGTVSVSIPTATGHAATKGYVDGLTIVNGTTVALSSSDLNTAYPSVNIGTRVICKDIIAGGLIYTKVTEAGSSDIWVSTPCTVVV